MTNLPNKQNYSEKSSGRRRYLLPLMVLALVMITSSIVGYILGQRAGTQPIGQLMDTIVLEPTEKEALKITVSGILVDTKGNPVANTKVELHSTPRVTTTDKNGAFFFHDVENGNHKIIVTDAQGKAIAQCDITLDAEDKYSITLDKEKVYQLKMPLDTLMIEIDLIFDADKKEVTLDLNKYTVIEDGGKISSNGKTVVVKEGEEYITPHGNIVDPNGNIQARDNSFRIIDRIYTPISGTTDTPETKLPEGSVNAPNDARTNSPRTDAPQTDAPTGDSTSPDPQPTPDPEPTPDPKPTPDPEPPPKDDPEIDESGAVTVSDKNVTWTQMSAINLFGDAEKLLPGTEGVYSFKVNNTKKYSIFYTMTISESHKDGAIPFEYRLKDKNGEYLAGTQNKWLTAKALESVSIPLKSGENSQYTLEWRWPYETAGNKNDSLDTSIGSGKNTNHIIYVSIRAERML